MTRAFRPEPLPAHLLDRLLDVARRAPSAGNTAGLRFLVLDEPAAVAAYWDTTLAPERRPGFPWPALLDAPVLVIPAVSAAAYVRRYGEADKVARRAAGPAARRALGSDRAAWAVPYWHVDGGMAVMNLLLAAEAAGLGALFFGLFEQAPDVCRRFGIPPDWEPLGTVALGWPAPPADQRPSASARRGRPPLSSVVSRGHWSGRS